MIPASSIGGRIVEAVAPSSASNLPLEGETRLVVIQPSSFCNIDCTYCYVPNRSDRSIISPLVLEDILAKVFRSTRVVNGFRLVWHNGEPLSLGIDFYKQAFSLIDKHNQANKEFLNCIQTNATLVNQAWADFFIANKVSPSVSIDGPRQVHNSNRKTRSGSGTFDAVMKGVAILRKNNIGLVGLCVVTAEALSHGRDIVKFFIDEGFSSLGLIIEEPWGGNADTSFTRILPADRGNVLEGRFRTFIEDVFDEWLPYADKLDVREFNDMFAAFRRIKLDGKTVVRSEDSSPCTVLSFSRDGDLTTFSPQMVAGTLHEPRKFAVANISEIENLDFVSKLPAHQKLEHEIRMGIAQCESECGYFQVCGGGSPASKFYEHNTFNCTETRQCRFAKQLLANVLLEKVSHLPPSKHLVH